MRSSVSEPQAQGVVTPLWLAGAVTAIFITGAGLGSAWMTGYLPVRAFNSEVWKAERETGTRVNMVNALIGDVWLKEMTRGEIIDLLGQPTETTDFRDWDFAYDLGLERGLFRTDREWLVLDFGPDDRVVAWAIVRD
ncbi:hypothetical protein ACFPIF_09820 [Brevundimonas faecalis]|uniref:hypothetical protein n=1 Tax=Brevundimonas faecalis TaxID=947378 RepID=UPI003618F073